MKKLICLAAALTLALTACGGRPAQESPGPDASAPAPSVTALVTAAPTSKPTVPAEPSGLPSPGAETSASAASETPAPSETPVETPAAVTFALTPAPTESADLPSPSTAPSPCPVPAAETPAPSPMPTVQPTLEPIAEPTVEPTPVRPSDKEVLDAYHQAAEAYTWFDRTTLPLDYSVTKMVGETPYNPVADERFPTLDSLRVYLKTLFSDEIVDTLLPMDGERYVDIDGVLCGIQADRGTDVTKGGSVETVVWPEGDAAVKCTVKISVELLSENDVTTVVGEEVHEFPYQKVGDKWVFTHFGAIM